jgi:hypothetical protein
MQDIAKRHQLNIARKTMRLSCVGTRILGGMDHIEAAKLLKTKTDADCECFSNIPLSKRTIEDCIADDHYNILAI